MMDNYEHFVKSADEQSLRCPECGQEMDDEFDVVQSLSTYEFVAWAQSGEEFFTKTYRHRNCIYPPYDIPVLVRRKLDA